MIVTPGIHRIDTLEMEAIRRAATANGFAVFSLPGWQLKNKTSFFAAVRSEFPLDPPLGSVDVWDALVDSLWEGLYSLPNSRIAILWPNSTLMSLSSPRDFSDAVEILELIYERLADADATIGAPKEVAVYLGQS